MLHIHNSLTKQKELFKPIAPGKIKMYVCGITVYDYCHIGHARTVLAFDVMYRYFLNQGFDVTFVRNITDIEDKIIKRAKENNEPMHDLTARFIHAMHEDFNALGALSPTHEPRATETLAQMIEMIQTLINKGLAYAAENGDVYYHVKKFATYGVLSHRHLDDLMSGARVEVNEMKQDPLDFVLWKSAKLGEPSWPSPWGEGRPGWHIECSAMSKQLLGDTFDIHGGGHDLLFPHHENERAQSEGANDKKFVNTWIHTGFVNVDDEKMSKSLGNFFTIREVLKVFDAETIRFFLVSSHYRSPVNYSEDNLKQARSACERLYMALRGLTINDIELDQNNTYVKRFMDAMNDDFNTPDAISVLFDLAREINIAKPNLNAANQLASLLKKLADILGLLTLDPEVFLKQGQSSEISDAEVDQLIEDRIKARASKDFAQSDAIRDKLATLGIILEDSPQGTTWRRG